ncbi:CUE domain-containing protein 1, partial [Egretta garzetta]|uniref:CUE domain-containing protein 1 n=1 Tax=Egretta garzetta TaxID=188379 RepID=UPI00163CE4FE
AARSAPLTSPPGRSQLSVGTAAGPGRGEALGVTSWAQGFCGPPGGCPATSPRKDGGRRPTRLLLARERDRLKYESKKCKSTSVAVSNDFGFSSVISGDVAPSVTSEAGGAVSDDALFRDKLKHMGKSTRKKLFELARAFSEKTKMRKSKRKHLLKHQVLGTAASTANLLDDVEGHSCDEDFQARRQQLQEEEETPKEGQ